MKCDPSVTKLLTQKVLGIRKQHWNFALHVEIKICCEILGHADLDPLIPRFLPLKSSLFFSSDKNGPSTGMGQYPKIGKWKKNEIQFFLSKTCIVNKFWHFCSHLYRVTNLLPKLIDMLLFSAEKNWISIFWVPLFLGIRQFKHQMSTQTQRVITRKFSQLKVAKPHLPNIQMLAWAVQRWVATLQE